MRRPAVVTATSPGQALVEFAFAFPLLLVLLFAVIDFGRLSFTYISLSNGIAEMARQMSIPATSDANVVAAFNNLDVILGTVKAGDNVTLQVYDTSGAQQGVTRTCPLPLTTSTCTIPARTVAYRGGYVVVGATYTFVFAPKFSSPFGTGFWEPNVTITPTTRAYIG